MTTLASRRFGQITSDISGNNGLVNGDYRVVQHRNEVCLLI